MLPATIILRILVTGVCAIVPSAADHNLTRLIAPAVTQCSTMSHGVPDHFAFIEVHEGNFKPSPPDQHFKSRQPDLSYHNREDLPNEKRLVFILHSEEVKVSQQPTNLTLEQNAGKPANLLAPVDGTPEPTSTKYELLLENLCPTCGPIDDAFFDVARNPDKVAARLDLHGGRESVTPPNLNRVWHIDDKHPNQPLAQEVAYDFDLPQGVHELDLELTKFKNKLDVAAGTVDSQSRIHLVSTGDEPIEVTFGNAPLRDIINLDAGQPAKRRDDHIAVIADMLTSAPFDFPVPELVNRQTDVRGINDDCVPIKPPKQDPGIVSTSTAAGVVTQVKNRKDPTPSTFPELSRRLNFGKDLPTATSEARAAADSTAGNHDARTYVATFADVLRTKLSSATPADIAPLPIDSSTFTTKMYGNYKSMITRAAGQQVGTEVFIGDTILGALRSEVVSLFPGGNVCSGIIIAKNAVATAAHCVSGAPKYFLLGNSIDAGSAIPIKSDSKFTYVSTPTGEPLDMAIIVQASSIGLDDAQLPVFASASQIASAQQLTIVGFGGNVADASDAGLKRLGTIPMASPDCAGPGEKDYFGCHPGFDMVGGARPVADRTSCPNTAAAVVQHGACSGDSGGAVYVDTGSKLLLAGLIRSINESCGCANATNVYVRFDKQIDFLKGLPGIEFPPAAFAEVTAPAVVVPGAR